MKTANFYVATNRFQPSRTLLFGMLSGATFAIDSNCISIVQANGVVCDMPLGDNKHFYVEVGTHPIDR